MQKMSKKGFQISEIPSLAMVFVVIAVVLGVGATILGQIRDTQTANSYEYNITTEGLDAQTDLSEWQGTC